MQIILAEQLKKGDKIQTLAAGILTIVDVEIYKDRDLVIVTYNNGRTWEFCLDDDVEIQ